MSGEKTKKLQDAIFKIKQKKFETPSIIADKHELAIAENDKEKHKDSLRYRMKIFLKPNGENLIRKFSKSAGIPYEEYLNYLENNKNLKINFQESTFHPGRDGFSFTVFNNEGMIQIWSNFHKDFVDEIEIHGQMFSCEFSDEKKLTESPYKQAIKYLVATPTHFGFAHFARGVDREGILAEIPFSKIISFFENLYRNEGNQACKCAIKSFSKELVGELNKYNVVYNKFFMEDYGMGCSEKDFNYKNLELYSDWAKNNSIEVYDQQLKFHQFDTEYYSVFVNFEFEVTDGI